MATSDLVSDVSHRLVEASKVNGVAVHNLSGERVGEIYDLLIEKISGKTEFVILSVGGFLGIGTKYYPIPWNFLKYDTVLAGYVADISRDRIESAPGYSADEGRQRDDTWGTRIRDYWT